MAVALLVVCPAMAGCVTNSDLETLRLQTNELKDNAAQMERQITRTDRRIEIIDAQGRRMGEQLAEISARLDAVGHKLQEMTGTLERNAFDTNRIEETLRIQSRELQKKLRELEGQIRELQLAMELQEENQARIKNTQERITTIVGKSKVRARGSPNQPMYYQARAKLRRKEYAEAIKQFQGYITRYPKSDLADNAQYWIGEALYAQGRYEEAVLALDKVITQYKKGNKVAAALLKQGMSFWKIGDQRSAQILFKRVISEFPSSREAALAKREMQKQNSTNK